ncbi:leucine rich repeat protein, partial [Cystoisospora suis]
MDDRSLGLLPLPQGGGVGGQLPGDSSSSSSSSSFPGGSSALVTSSASPSSPYLDIPLKGTDNELTGIVLKHVVEIFPQTAEMKLLIAKRLEQVRKKERKGRRKTRERAKRSLRREEELRKLKQQKKKQRDIEEKRRLEEEMRNREDDNLSQFLRTCLENETPADLSLTGFTQVQIRVIVRDALCSNSSILSLDLSRAGLTEEDGPCIALLLKTNKVLSQLDLEGNHFGLNSAKAFRKALEVNDTLRSLNVESCSFTCRGDEQSGIVELSRGLKVNKGLRSLNLRNNQIDDEGGDALLDALAWNRTLIQLDVSFNDLTMEQLREIQSLIDRNYEAFVEVKKHEKRERLQMKHEEESVKVYLMHLASKRVMIEGSERRRLAREKAYEDRKILQSRQKKGRTKKGGKK